MHEYTHRQLSAMDLTVGVASLNQYLVQSFGSPTDVTSFIGPFDVAQYFPQFQMGCGHCANQRVTRLLYAFARRFIGGVIRREDRSRLGSAVRYLIRGDSDSPVDSQIGYIFVWVAIQNGWETDELSCFGPYLLNWTVSGSLTETLGLDFLEANRRVMGNALLAFDRLSELEEVRGGALEVQRITNDVLNGTQETAMATLLNLVAEGRGFSRPMRLYASRLDREGTVEESLVWYQFLRESNNVTWTYLYPIFAAHGREKVTVPDQVRRFVADGTQRAIPDFTLTRLLEYAAASGDKAFGGEVLDRVLGSMHPGEYRISMIAVRFYVLTNDRHRLRQLGENTVFMSSADGQLLDYLASVRGEIAPSAQGLMNDILDFVRAWPNRANFLLLVRAIVFSESGDPTFVAALPGRLEAFLNEHPNPNDSIRNALVRSIFELKLVLKTLGPQLEASISRFLPEELSLSNKLFGLVRSEWHSSTPILDDYEAVGNAVLRSVLDVYVSNPDAGVGIDVVTFVLTLMASRQHSPTSDLLASMYARGLTTEDPEHLVALVKISHDSFPDAAAIAVGKATRNLFYAQPSGYLARDFARLAIQAGVTLDSRSAALYLQQDWKSGEFGDANALEGLPSESWSQLSVIFEEVMHELNQPLSGLTNRIQGMKRAGYQNIGQDNWDKSIDVLESLTRHIADRIYSYQSITADEGVARRFNIAKLVAEVVENQQSLAAELGVAIIVNDSYLRDSRWVFGAPMQFRIAFQNLLRNASKALTQVNRDRQISIDLFNPRQNDALVYVRVRDNGPGIPPDQQARIFDKGFTTKLGHGLGLGLALAASTVTASGGILKLERSDDAGSEFVIVLPSSANSTEISSAGIDLAGTEDESYEVESIEEMENYRE